MKKKALFIFFALALAPGLAASSGEGGHIDWFSVLAKVFNSTVLFGGLILLLRKPLIQMLSQKSLSVRNDIEEREKILAATEIRLQDVRRRLAEVAAEVAVIKNGAETAGRAELDKLEKAGRVEAERIVSLSEAEIRQRVDAAVRAVRGRIADLAIERFREDFKKGLDAATQQKIIDRNIDASGGLGDYARPLGGLSGSQDRRPHGSLGDNDYPQGGLDEGK
jgi:F0F1-type ATP synthase membrane subunit b/b'